MKIIVTSLALAALTSITVAEPNVNNHNIHLSVVSGTPTSVIPVVSANPTQWFLDTSAINDAATDDTTEDVADDGEVDPDVNEKRQAVPSESTIIADSTVFAEKAAPTPVATDGGDAAAMLSTPTATGAGVVALSVASAGDMTDVPTVAPTLSAGLTITDCTTCTDGPTPTFGSRGPTGDPKSLSASWTSKHLTSVCGKHAPKQWVSIVGSSALCDLLSHGLTITNILGGHKETSVKRGAVAAAQTTPVAPVVPPVTSLFPTQMPNVASIQSALSSRKSAGIVWTTPSPQATVTAQHTAVNHLAAEMSMFSSLMAKLFPHITKPGLAPTTFKTIITSSPATTPQMHTMGSVNSSANRASTSSVDLNCPGC